MASLPVCVSVSLPVNLSLPHSHRLSGPRTHHHTVIFVSGRAGANHAPEAQSHRWPSGRPVHRNGLSLTVTPRSKLSSCVSLCHFYIAFVSRPRLRKNSLFVAHHSLAKTTCTAILTRQQDPTGLQHQQTLCITVGSTPPSGNDPATHSVTKHTRYPRLPTRGGPGGSSQRRRYRASSNHSGGTRSPSEAAHPTAWNSTRINSTPK